MYFNILDAQDIDMSPIVVNFTAPGDIPSQACTMFAPVDDLVLSYCLSSLQSV